MKKLLMKAKDYIERERERDLTKIREKVEKKKHEEEVVSGREEDAAEKRKR